MNTKVDEGKLISGKEALIALANGEEVQQWNGSIFWDIDTRWQVSVFFQNERKFRLKPRTISINGIEVPAPFKPKEGEDVWCISDDHGCGYCCYAWHKNHSVQVAAWRTEEEIKQVVAVLRQVFGGSHDN